MWFRPAEPSELDAAFADFQAWSIWDRYTTFARTAYGNMAQVVTVFLTCDPKSVNFGCEDPTALPGLQPRRS
jgi:hypothetical protein